MKEFQINAQTEGQRLNKVLQKLLPGAGSSFLYKMLRKKNITVNDRKADGAQILREGDIIRIWFSDETYRKFSCGEAAASEGAVKQGSGKERKTSAGHLAVLYEDDDLLFVNKPAGMLVQPDARHRQSLLTDVSAYFRENAEIQDDGIFRVGPANRLDRNTSGIVAFGKTIRGQQYLAGQFRERDMKKYYLALVKGVIETPPGEEQILSGWYVKDRSVNMAQLYTGEMAPPGAIRVRLGIAVIRANGHETLVRVHLITGKSHQIRVQMASAGHPVAGDPKYGDAEWNAAFASRYHLNGQFLHAWRLELKDLAGKELIVTAPLPQKLMQVLKGEDLWEPGIPEA